jgi:hypothetical protein
VPTGAERGPDGTRHPLHVRIAEILGSSQMACRTEHLDR